MADHAIVAVRQSILPEHLELGPVVYWRGADCARFVFRGDEAARARAARALGVECPAALRAVARDGIAVLWQGPDEFLIHAPLHDRARIAASLSAALEGQAFSLVDVSHRNVSFTLSGRDAALLLATGVMLDLAEAQYPVGMTTRTLLSKADITLWRQEVDVFHVEIWRSFAPYVLSVLAEGARGL